MPDKPIYCGNCGAEVKSSFLFQLGSSGSPAKIVRCESCEDGKLIEGKLAPKLVQQDDMK